MKEKTKLLIRGAGAVVLAWSVLLLCMTLAFTALLFFFRLMPQP